MKRIILATLAAALLLPLVCHSAQRRFITADAGPYSKFEVGPTFQQDGEITKFTGFPDGNNISYDVGFAFDAAIGYAFNKWVSVEGEFGWNGNSIDKVQGIQQSDTFLYNAPFLVNVVFQYPIHRTRLVPYVGGGVGGSASIFDTDIFSNGAVTIVGSDTVVVFAYQAFAGLRFEINENMFAGVGYKYFGTSNATFSFDSAFGGPDLDLGISGASTHMVLFSFNMKF
jgi:opacity protein-like surface antigen